MRMDEIYVPQWAIDASLLAAAPPATQATIWRAIAAERYKEEEGRIAARMGISVEAYRIIRAYPELEAGSKTGEGKP